jgi:hypothetical protein
VGVYRCGCGRYIQLGVKKRCACLVLVLARVLACLPRGNGRAAVVVWCEGVTWIAPEEGGDSVSAESWATTRPRTGRAHNYFVAWYAMISLSARRKRVFAREFASLVTDGRGFSRFGFCPKNRCRAVLNSIKTIRTPPTEDRSPHYTCSTISTVLALKFAYCTRRHLVGKRANSDICVGRYRYTSLRES